MKNFWSQDLFFRAFSFAARAHNGQKIPGSDLPYITHIACVCAELMAVVDEKVDGELAIQCGALHDTIEDTKTTFPDIEKEFGNRVAMGVNALSKNRELDKAIQLEESISRILQEPKEIWMVKMADRITNLNPPPSFWTDDKKQHYLEQSVVLYDTFKDANSTLAGRLKQRIEEYKFYL